MTIKLCKCMFLSPYQELIGAEICDEVNKKYISTYRVLISPHAPRDVQVIRPVDPIFLGLGAALAESPQTWGTVKVQGRHSNPRSSIDWGITRTAQYWTI